MIHYIGEQNFIFQNVDVPSLKLDPTDVIIVLIKADWCGHCVRFVPEYELQSVKHSDVNFLVVEHTTNERMLTRWSKIANPAFVVEGFPTVVMFDNVGHPVRVIQDKMKIDEEITAYRLASKKTSA